MGSNDWEWAKHVYLSLFVVIGLYHGETCWKKFYIPKNGWIQALVCGEKITINQKLIAQQFGVNVKGTIDASNALVKKTQVAFKNISRSDAFE